MLKSPLFSRAAEDFFAAAFSVHSPPKVTRWRQRWTVLNEIVELLLSAACPGQINAAAWKILQDTKWAVSISWIDVQSSRDKLEKKANFPIFWNFHGNFALHDFQDNFMMRKFHILLFVQKLVRWSLCQHLPIFIGWNSSKWRIMLPIKESISESKIGVQSRKLVWRNLWKFVWRNS